MSQHPNYLKLNMKKLLPILCVMLAAASLRAGALEFDFKDPKGVNNIIFQMDAPLESINGVGTGVAGKVKYDPAAPASLAGSVVLEAASLHVGNPTMKEHMHGATWMNVAAHPQIIFAIAGLKDVKQEKDAVTGTLHGKMTLKGVTKEISFPVKLNYLKDKLKARSGKEGDLLVVRANFEVSRKDFGINPGQGEDKVSDTVAIKLSLAGSAPR